MFLINLLLGLFGSKKPADSCPCCDECEGCPDC